MRYIKNYEYTIPRLTDWSAWIELTKCLIDLECLQRPGIQLNLVLTIGHLQSFEVNAESLTNNLPFPHTLPLNMCDSIAHASQRPASHNIPTQPLLTKFCFSCQSCLSSWRKGSMDGRRIQQLDVKFDLVRLCIMDDCCRTTTLKWMKWCVSPCLSRSLAPPFLAMPSLPGQQSINISQ